MKWIISELFYPDEVSTALIMTEIAEKFAKSGPISVICGPTGYEKSYAGQRGVLDKNILIHRVNIPDLNKNRLLTRILRLMLLTLKMTFKIIFKVKKGDEVLIVTNPIFLLMTVGLLKSIKKIKLNILVHDVFPDNLVPAGLMVKESYKYKILNKIFNWAYRKGDKLIVLGDDMADLMSNKLQIKKSKIIVIPNWSDSTIHPIVDYSAADYFKIPLEGKITIGFAGNIGRVQGIPDFINAFISASNANLSLVLIGDGAMKNEIQKDLEERNVRNIFLVGSRSRSEQLDFLNACDIALITLKEGMKGLGVPSKTYNIMAAAKPILYIGDDDSEVDKYIKRFNNGWSFNWGDKEILIDFLQGLSTKNLQSINDKGRKSLTAVLSHFQKKDVLQLFEDL